MYICSYVFTARIYPTFKLAQQAKNMDKPSKVDIAKVISPSKTQSKLSITLQFGF